MKFVRTAAVAAALCSIAAVASAADTHLKAMFTVLPLTRSVPLPEGQSPRLSPLPSWNYTVKDPVAGQTYKGTILGGNAFGTTFGTTTLPVQVVPLIVTLNDGSTTVKYDPTAKDPCNSNLVETTYVADSLIFTKSTVWKLNGTDVGQTQYIDAFQRAEFWSKVKGSNYHVLFSHTQLTAQKVTFKGANANNYTGGCSSLGIANVNAVDAFVQKLIRGALASSINVGTLPLFLLHNVVMSTDPANLNDCCIIGYHGSLIVGGKLQVYSVADVDSTGLFNGLNDIAALSHEMGEATNDPTGNNPTAPWGHIGQVSGCQSNFEVGDPLSGTELPAVTSDGNTYHVQELAFFSWFYHSKPSLGTGGKFSDNGTFTTSAATCS